MPLNEKMKFCSKKGHDEFSGLSAISGIATDSAV